MSESRSTQSGLGRVQRDWTEGQTSSSQEEPIAWPPSPPKPQAAAQPMTAAQKRLKAIEEALRPKHAPSAPSIPSQSSNKRSSSALSTPAASFAQDRPAKKARQVEGVKATAPSQVASTKKAVKASSKGPASIFLSDEQKKILSLVTKGEKLFYTGSAGT